MEVECPVDGCDYSGAVKSVEAHISGNSRDEHQGKVGRQFREQLLDQAEEGVPQPVDLEPEEKAEVPAVLGEETQPSETTQQGGSEGVEGVEQVDSASPMGLVAGTVLLGLAVVLQSSQAAPARSEGEAEATSEETVQQAQQTMQSGPEPVLGGA